MPARIDDLVHEPQCEHNLSQRPEYQKPRRNVGIAEQGTEEAVGIAETEKQSDDRSQSQDPTQHLGQRLPDFLGPEIPHINIVSDDLPQDNGKILPEPSVKRQKPSPGYAQYPVDLRALDLMRPLRDEPLQQQAGRKQKLGYQAYQINPYVFLLQHLLEPLAKPVPQRASSTRCRVRRRHGTGQRPGRIR